LQGADNSSQDGILVRVLRIQPSTNYTRSKVSLAWHRDEWYEDKFGQNPAPFYSAAGSAGMGLPLPWRPDSEVPHSSLFDATELNFSVAQVYQTLADGTSLAQLQISGRPPVNQLSTGATAAQRPLVERQGLTAATGGSIAGPASGSQSYVIGLCSVDSNGLLSPLSHLINVAIPAGTSTNTLGTGIIFWPPNTAGYRVFAGPDVNHLSFQTGGTGTPDSITLTSLNVASYGPPDPAFDHFQVRAKRNIHAGVFGLAISSLTSGTITFDAESFTTNQWAGYTLSIVGKPNSQANIPIIDLLVVSNDATTLTVGVDPTGLGVEAGDVAIMRTKPDTHTATTIGDSNFVNSVDYFDPPYTILGASDESPIIIETDSDPGYITAQSVVVDGVLGNTAANGLWNSITKIDSTHYSLDGSTGSGEYSGGGTVRAFTEGLVANQEVGHLVRIIAGTGRGQSPRRIISNTQTVLTVDVPFNPIPDSTSVFIIEEASWQYSVDTGKITSSNPNPGTPALVATVNVDNLEHQTVLVQVVTEDANDDVSIQNAAPIRELFLFGAPGSDSKKFEKATFNIAVSKDLEVGNLDDVPVYVVKQGGTPGISITTIPKMPPVGAAAILDIIQTPANGSYAPTSIFASGGITIPDGSPNTIIQANFRTGIVFAENDRLSPKCTQVGSTQPGRLISVVVKWDIS
jgi:hypothetical protein